MTDNSDMLYVEREHLLYIIYGIKGKHSYITVQKPSSKRDVTLTLHGRTACMGLGKLIKISGFKTKEKALEFYLERVRLDDTRRK